MLSSLSKASGTAQIHRDWGVVKTSGGVRGVIALEAVLVVPLLSLFWDESSHLIVISSSKDLIDGFLRYDTVDGSFLQDLVVVARGWFEDILSYAWDQSSYEVSVGGGVSQCVPSFGGQLFKILDILIDEGPGHLDAFKTCAGSFAFLGVLELVCESV